MHSLISRYKKLPIKLQLLLLAVSTILIVTFIIFFNFNTTANTFIGQNDRYMKSALSQIKQSAFANTDTLNNIITSIAYNSAVQQFLIEKDPAKKIDLNSSVSSLLSNMSGLKSGVVSIVLLGEDKSTYYLSGEIIDINRLKGSLPVMGKVYYSDIRSLKFNYGTKNCFIAGMRIYSVIKKEAYGTPIGTILAIVGTSAITGDVGSVVRESGTEIYLMDRNNKVYAADESQKNAIHNEEYISKLPLESNNDFFKTNINGKSYFIQVDSIPQIGSRIISAAPQEELLSGIMEIRKTEIFTIIIAFSLLALPFFLITNNITRPVKKMMHFLKETKLGNMKNLNKKLQLEGYEEINLMAEEFNSMMDEINLLTQRLIEANTRLYETELAKKNSELAYMRYQMNPHFLYNTLESIKGMAIEENSNKIFDAARSLIQVFKYSVKGEDMVLLEEELDVIKSYLKIQKLRFFNRLEVSYDFTEPALKCKVFKMILQPLVENAFCHGLEPKEGTWRLDLRGKINGEGILSIKIKDNGIGIDEPLLADIRKSLKCFTGAGANVGNKFGIGIGNVNNLIKLYYGEQYGLEIESTAGEGTEITISIPAGGVKNG